MQKRHGIIVGVTILVIAFVITMITSFISNKKEVGGKNPPISVSTDSVANSSGGTDKVKDNQNNGGNNTSNKDVTNIDNNVNSSVSNKDTSKDDGTISNNVNIFEVANDMLLNPTEVLNEIMLVSSKKVMLIDLDVNSNQNKQMVYVLDMLTADSKKVSLYVNGVVYDDVEIGDTLNIQYNKYVNSKGVEIPLVIQATKTTSSN